MGDKGQKDKTKGAKQKNIKKENQNRAKNKKQQKNR